MRLWIRRAMFATLDVILSVIGFMVGAVVIIPEVLFVPIIKSFAFYPKAKMGLKEIQSKIDSVTTGIGEFPVKLGERNFAELGELLKRVYYFEGSFDEIKFEIHALDPEIDYKTSNLVSTEKRCYVILLNAGKKIKAEIVDSRLLELKLELDFMTRKRFAIAFVLISWAIIILGILKK